MDVLCCGEVSFGSFVMAARFATAKNIVGLYERLLVSLDCKGLGQVGGRSAAIFRRTGERCVQYIAILSASWLKVHRAAALRRILWRVSGLFSCRHSHSEAF